MRWLWIISYLTTSLDLLNKEVLKRRERKRVLTTVYFFFYFYFYNF